MDVHEKHGASHGCKAHIGVTRLMVVVGLKDAFTIEDALWTAGHRAPRNRLGEFSPGINGFNRQIIRKWAISWAYHGDIHGCRAIFVPKGTTIRGRPAKKIPTDAVGCRGPIGKHRQASVLKTQVAFEVWKLRDLRC